MTVLGIDISKANFDAALLETSSASPATKPSQTPRRASRDSPPGSERIPSTPAWKPPTPTAMPSPASSTTHGHTVSVVNPARIKAFAQTHAARAKTDKADAALIARFCLMHQPEPWSPPCPEVAQLQALVRRLESLQEMQQMEKNRRDTAPATLHATIDEHIAFLDGQITEDPKGHPGSHRYHAHPQKSK